MHAHIAEANEIRQIEGKCELLDGVNNREKVQNMYMSRVDVSQINKIDFHGHGITSTHTHTPANILYSSNS